MSVPPPPSKVGSVSTEQQTNALPPQHQLTSIASSLSSSSSASSSSAGTTIQLASSCVTIHPTQSNTFSWPQNSSLQFVSTSSQSCASGSNNTTTFSLIPQQLLQVPATTMLQMPNGTLGTQMLVTQNRPSTPASASGYATSGSNTICSIASTGNTSSAGPAPIVQIIQTPNGPAQLLSAGLSPLTSNSISQPKSSASPGIALNSSNNGSSLAPNFNSRTSKQILPKLSSKNQSCSSTNATLSSTITTSNTPTLNQSIAGSQFMFSNGQTGFLTQNGTFLLSSQIQMQPMNQQQLLIPSGISNQLTNTSSANPIGTAQPMQYTAMQTGASSNAVKTGSTQTLLIPASPNQGASVGQIKLQPVIQQPSAPQILQIQTANGPMFVVCQPSAGPSSTATPDSATTLLQTLTTGNGQQLQIIPTNPQDALFSTGAATNQLFLAPSSLSSYSSAPTTSLTTTLSSQTGNIMSSGPFLTGTTTTNVVNSAVKPKTTRRKNPTKKEKDREKALTIASSSMNTLNASKPASKGVNLAELLKETGIIESSPPASPQYTTSNTTDMPGEPLASISTIDLNDPSNLLSSAGSSLTNGTQLSAGLAGFAQGTTIQPTASGLSQQTVLMTAGATPGSGGPYYIGPISQPAQTTQLKLAFAPDGSVILQPVTAYGQTATGLTAGLNATSQGIKIGDAITLRDASAPNSAQPSPDSTTPTLDAILPGSNGKFVEGSAFKLTDSISLTIQNSTTPMDDRRSFQQNSTTVIPVGVKSESKKAKAKKESKKTTRKGSATSNQQLITIPIQTNLSSTTITPVISHASASQTAVIQIGEGSSLKSTLNGQLKKNEPTSNMLLLSSNSSLLGGNDSSATGAISNTTTSSNTLSSSSETPVMQISLNNQELYERLETQIKTLSQLKTPTAQQRNLLQELVELQKTMQSAKQQSSEGQSTDTNIILTSQPLLPQSAGGLQSTPEITIQSKPITANTQLLTPLKSKENSNTQIITITSKPLESSAACKLDLGSSNIKSEPGLNSIVTADVSNESNNFKLLAGNCSNTLTGSSQGTTIQVGNQIITITTPSSSSISNTPNSKQCLRLPSGTIIKNRTLSDGSALTSTVESDKLKATRTAKFSFSFQQQLLADQTAAARPDTKNPFRNRNDACKRLLRYHVFYQDDVPDYKVQQFDNDFEVLSRHLLQRKENLYRKFQSHMLKLSMQESRPGESVMVNQMFVDTETTQLKQDKEFVAQGGQLYLPSIPDHWIQPNNDENCAGTALDHDLTRKRKCSDSSENHLYSQSKRNDPNEIEMHESSQLMSNSCLQASQPDHNLDNLHNPNENVNSVDDLNDFSKYLSSCGELGPIDDFGLYGTTSSVSNLTNDTSNTPAAFGSMLGLDTNRTDQNNDDSAAANDFMLWRPEDAFACDSNSNLDCKLGPNNNSNGISTSNWGNSFGNQTEDDVAVESILSGTALPSNSNERHTNQVLDTLDLHSLTGLSMPDTMTAKAVKHLNDDDDDDEDEDDDEDDDDEDDDEHDNNEHGLNRHSVTISSAPSIFNGSKMTVNSCSVVSSMVTGTSLEHSSQLPELGSLDTSDLTADMQMASAIDSILDIFVPGGSSGGNGSNVGDQSGSAPSGLMHSGSGMSGSYGFGNISTSTSSNSYRSGHSTGYSMNSSSMMNSQRALMQDFGNDTVLDEAVKSILS